MGHLIQFNGLSLAAGDGETVLDVLERGGQAIPSSCRAGACQSCLMRALEGTPPSKAQVGIKEGLRAQSYFLSCVCVPEGPMTVALPGEGLSHRATVLCSDDLGAAVRRVRLAAPPDFQWFAGQFITIFKDAGAARSYSVASSPEDGWLELHVRRIPGGLLSNWLHDEVAPGDELEFRGPSGECIYTGEDADAPLLLAGTGTGLAPLYGVLRDALRRSHRGPIALFHGALEESGLYLRAELEQLGRGQQMSYTPCVLKGAGAENGLSVGALDEIVLALPHDVKRTRAYLCGDPALVAKLRKKLFLKGLPSRHIMADAFAPTAPAKG